MRATREDYGLVFSAILVAIAILWWRTSQSAVALWAQIAAVIAFMIIVCRSGRPFKFYNFGRVTAHHLAFLIVGTILVLLFASKLRDNYGSALSEAVSAVE